MVDIQGELVIESDPQPALKAHVVEHLDQVAVFCGVDIFILGPKFQSPSESLLNGNGEISRDQRWRIAIYGDMESTEHAKTRVLIYIDRLVSRISVAYDLY